MLKEEKRMTKKGLPACLCLSILITLTAGTNSMAIVNDEPPAETAVTQTPAAEPVAEIPVYEPVTEIPAYEPVTEVPAAEAVTETITAEGPAEAPAAEAVTEIPAAEAAAEAPASETAVTPAVSSPEPMRSLQPAVLSPAPAQSLRSEGALPEPEAVKPSLEDIQARLDAADCPESIKEFVRNYPEAITFAEGYNEYTRNPPVIDVSAEMKNGGIPLFIQWDPRWGYHTYGADFIGIDGCGPTCMSMVVCGLTGSADWNPFALALWAYNQGYYQYGVGTSWDLMTRGAPMLGLNAFPVETTTEGILTALQSGAPVVCSVSAGDFTQFGHFIILTGVDSTGMVTLNDPNSPINSAKKWDLQTILSQTVSTWAFSVN